MQISFADRIRRRFQRQVAGPFEERVRTPLRRLRNNARRFRPIFVAGAAGSGTSYLAVSLAQRFDCAGVVYEQDIDIDPDTFLFVGDPNDYSSVAAYERHMSAKADWSVEQGRDDLLRLFRGKARAAGEAIVSKAPDSGLVRVEFLDRCFPDAWWIAVFRDPVANVEGFRRKWRLFSDEPLAEAIRFYRAIHERFLEEAPRLGDRVLAVEYETLVEEPDAAFAEIGRRLGLAPATRPLRFQSRPNAEGMLGLRNVQKGEIQVVRDSNARARARLGSDEVAAIERELGPLRERLRSAPFTLRLDRAGAA